MRVLVIDDSRFIRELARVALGRFGGMEVAEAAGGAEGVERAVAWRPDAILLDARMPDLDGPTTLVALRARPETANIPIIFLTATTLASERARLLALGAAAILDKPFELPSLAAGVRNALAAA